MALSIQNLLSGENQAPLPAGNPAGSTSSSSKSSNLLTITTLALGEEEPRITSLYVGEEDASPPFPSPSTMALGEEDIAPISSQTTFKHLTLTVQPSDTHWMYWYLLKDGILSSWENWSAPNFTVGVDIKSDRSLLISASGQMAGKNNSINDVIGDYSNPAGIIFPQKSNIGVVDVHQHNLPDGTLLGTYSSYGATLIGNPEIGWKPIFPTTTKQGFGTTLVNQVTANIPSLNSLFQRSIPDGTKIFVTYHDIDDGNPGSYQVAISETATPPPQLLFGSESAKSILDFARTSEGKIMLLNESRSKYAEYPGNGGYGYFNSIQSVEGGLTTQETEISRWGTVTTAIEAGKNNAVYFTSRNYIPEPLDDSGLSTNYQNTTLSKFNYSTNRIIWSAIISDQPNSYAFKSPSFSVQRDDSVIVLDTNAFNHPSYATLSKYTSQGTLAWKKQQDFYILDLEGRGLESNLFNEVYFLGFDQTNFLGKINSRGIFSKVSDLGLADLTQDGMSSMSDGSFNENTDFSVTRDNSVVLSTEHSVKKINPNGQISWKLDYETITNLLFGIGKSWSFDRVHTDFDDNIYIVGSAYVDDLDNSSESDLFCAKFSKDGNLIWSRTFGEAGIDRVYSVDTDSMYLYVGGVNKTAGDGLLYRFSLMDGHLLAKNEFVGSQKSERIYGSTSSDLIDGFAGDDLIMSLAGDDLIDGGVGRDTIDGGAGSDSVDYGARTAAVVVTLAAAATTTVAVGGRSEDTIRNVENVTTGSGADRVIGDSAANTITTGNGNDLVRGGLGNDTLDGGLGIDTVDFSDKSAGVSIALNDISQAVSVVIGTESDIISNFENITGGSGNDRFAGNSANNTLLGGLGDDVLIGYGGADVLTGGAGRDTFRFERVDDGVDRITDFVRGTDKISLNSSAFGSLGGTVKAGNIKNLTQSQFARNQYDSDDYLIFNMSNRTLYYDADGSSSNYAAVAIATFSVSGLGINDFVLAPTL